MIVSYVLMNEIIMQEILFFSVLLLTLLFPAVNWEWNIHTFRLKGVSGIYFPCFPTKIYVVGTH